MAKLILRCNYMKDAPPAHLSNYVHYMGTRTGVEHVDDGKGKLPATVRQKRLVAQIVKDIPNAKELLEYTDYLAAGTRENAAEFITQALEYNLDIAAKRENYVDYIGTRPRAERMGEHGLFTDEGIPVVMSQLQKEIAEHKGVIWTSVISLRREDATRLGYDSAEQWMNLLRSKKAMLCEQFKIDSQNLRWYAAYHNEAHHPHLHLMVYSADENEGYLTPKGIDNMRSELAHDIFRLDFAQIYEEQNLSRQLLKDEAGAFLHDLAEKMSLGDVNNSKIESDLILLAEKLPAIKGRKQYGYMPKEIKSIVDRIVDEIAKNDAVSAAYAEWHRQWCEILKTYRNDMPDPPPLSEQETFKSIKNTVITEALKLSEHGAFLFENSSGGMTDSAHFEAPEAAVATAIESEDVDTSEHEDSVYFAPEAITPAAQPATPTPPPPDEVSCKTPPTPKVAATNILRALSKQFSEKADELIAYRAQHERKVISREKQKTLTFHTKITWEIRLVMRLSLTKYLWAQWHRQQNKRAHA